MVDTDSPELTLILRLVDTAGGRLSQREVRYLLMKVQEWDLAGEGKASLDDLYQVSLKDR